MLFDILNRIERLTCVPAGGNPPAKGDLENNAYEKFQKVSL